MRLHFLLIFLTIPIFARSQNRQEPLKSIGLTASLPWINNYCYYNYDQKKSALVTGFTGLGAAVFYNAGKNKISLNIGFTGDLPAPMGAFDYGKQGTRTNIGSAFGEMIYQRNLIGRISVIAGLNYVQYRFSFTSYVNNLPSYSTLDGTWGMTMGSAYRFTKIFSLALLYRPTLISPDKKQYRHLISLDARFDITLWRQR